MVQSKAKTVAQYVKELPPDRRREIESVRRVVRQRLPAGFVETMDFGMISYVVPLERYPDTYNKHPLGVAALAAQKQYNSLYLMAVYADPKRAKRFHDAYARTDKKLDMGKSCVRFRRAEDLPLDVVGNAIADVSVEEFIALYERSRRRE